MNYYISDLHLRHGNVIKFDNRPFETVFEMENTIINNWNSVVKPEDTVYILGDFCWETEKIWEEILDKLNGSKVLIRGNHDLKSMSASLRKRFVDVKDYKEVKDGGKRVVLCHYPMPFYRADYNEDMWHLYGHVHVTIEEDLLNDISNLIEQKDNRGNSKNKCHFINVGCMMPWMDYTPRTLEEIINGYEQSKL